jgi:hypothetical protein
MTCRDNDWFDLLNDFPSLRVVELEYIPYISSFPSSSCYSYIFAFCLATSRRQVITEGPEMMQNACNMGLRPFFGQQTTSKLHVPSWLY